MLLLSRQESAAIKKVRFLHLLMRNILIIISALFFISCSGSKETLSTQKSDPQVSEPIKPKPPSQQPNYKATTPLIWDLIHTELDIAFDFEKQHVIGEATLAVSPHFYQQNSISLDAKAFEIKHLGLTDNDSIKLNYSYNDLVLTINLEKSYSKNDTLQITINYVAKPNDVKEVSGSAIRGGQGLYFINPLNNTPSKPLQVWTQGETDYSSCWFPTLDEPNQKTTQEIAITVPDTLKTLSNGILEFSTENGNGTRTDIWVQNKAHSPYLFMLAIGNFSIYEDDWRGLDVDYYTESNYAKDAPHIFEATPKMMEFYSTVLGVDYPWDKYAQVVVRDFVSGAMENTSATIHGEFVQRHQRELIDYPQEGIIAHELFHQWFGDLVSCESWANLALNEAFATYGEYLWVEHSKSAFDAQQNLLNKMNSYFREAQVKQVDFVRFDYDKKLDMFDGHTYSKGACILHQLRTAIGDKAFFEGLKRYLNLYAHKSAEMHQLRLIMEEVTGTDLNWFFNQWAFDNGHPVLEITYHFDSLKQLNFMVVKQQQDLNEFPLYQIPLQVKGYSKGNSYLDSVWVKNEVDTFYLKGSSANDWTDYDAQHYLLAEVSEPNRSSESWYLQFKANLDFEGTAKALIQLVNNHTSEKECALAVEQGLKHFFPGIRNLSIPWFYSNSTFSNEQKKKTLTELAYQDPNSKVRSTAYSLLRYLITTPEEIALYYLNANKDSSYVVIQTAIQAGIDKQDTARVLALCAAQENEDNEELKVVIAKAYSKFGNESHYAFFKENLNAIGAYKKAGFLHSFSDYLIELNNTQLLVQGYATFRETLLKSNSNWIKSSAANSLIDFYNSAKNQLSAANETITEGEATSNENIEELQMRFDAIETNIKTILDTEKNEMVLKRLGKR